MTIRSWAVAVMMFVALGATGTARADCDEDTNVTAVDAVLSGFNNWAAIRETFHRFESCEDQVLSEGYSDAIGSMLGKHWNTFPELSRLAAVDPEFRAFVVAHVNVTVDQEDLMRIIAAADHQCPHGDGPLCADLKTAAQAAKQTYESEGFWPKTPSHSDADE